MFKDVAKLQAPAPITPLHDRIANAESILLSFTAEHSLAFTMVPAIIDLTKYLVRDKKASDSLSMNRTTASYKTRFGLGKTFSEEVISDMKTHFFSLNMDESTSSNFQKVLTILVSYFSPVQKQVVVHHFSSLTCVKVNSESLYSEVVGIMEKNDIPWTNLMSILMDSCNVMRGSKSGFETRIRSEKAPHLSDVDGDACHHVHNAAKAFCKPFQYFVEQLFNDLFNDFKWSPDLRELFQEICTMMNVKYTMPQRYVSHRWLSVYDVTVDTLRLFDCLTVFYFPLLTEKERVKYLPTLVEIYHRLGVSSSSRERITEIRKELSQKKLTKEGKDRKDRILERVFTQRKLSKMMMGLHSSVFPLLKHFVLLFEMKEPLIHQIHEEQVKLFKEFLGCYVKPEVIKTGTSSLKLKNLDIKTQDNLLGQEKMFLGTEALKLVQGSPKDHVVKAFLKQVEESYVLCGSTLQKKLPLSNTFLKAVAAIHPDASGHSVTLAYLQKLPTLAPNVLNEEECDKYEMEIRKFQTDILPDFEEDTRIDHWWGREDVSKRYPCLSKMARSLLSCFHGPQVESSFNVMNDIIDNKSGRINIETYNSIQTIKYGLGAVNQSATQYYAKEDFLHEKVDTHLVRNMRSACRRHKEELDALRAAKEEKKQQLNIKPKGALLSKRKAKELYIKAAKKARLSHQKCVKN